MAKETKVGLLAGLAFIVCFAIILTNRGRDSLIDEQLAPYGVRTTTPALHHAQPSVAERSNRWPPSSDTRSAALLPSHGQGMQPTPPVEPRNTPVNQSVADAGASKIAPPGRRFGEPLAASSNKEQGSASWQQRLAALERKINAVGSPVETGAVASDAVRSPARSSVATPAVKTRRTAKPAASKSRERTHAVVAGDTLSGIAATHYGSRRKLVVDALFEANRSILSSPDEVRIGMTLRLPAIKGVTLADGPRAGSRAPKTRVATAKVRVGQQSTSSRSFRFYTVQSDDRYASIARRELGSEGRWKEIFELNKRVFPNPNVIRPGVRIKLPRE